jgi:hypothetical protein
MGSCLSPWAVASANDSFKLEMEEAASLDAEAGAYTGPLLS